jgi:hypothetical protein
LEITRAIFESQQQRRFGVCNPERMKLEFWEWMVRSSEDARLRESSDETEPYARGHTPCKLRMSFGQDGDYSKGPVWNFDRMGATRTPHPDGRMICIGGEHEDSYDPDFCIYNDVIILDLDGSVEIDGYPKDVFPPTDFHSSTLLGDRVIVIGRLGYMGERHSGSTPVFSLDLASYSIEELPSHGEVPGWIFGHEAELADGLVTIRGGEVWEKKDGHERIRRNFEDFAFDVHTGSWKRLTNRNWRLFSICNDGNKVFMPGPPFRGCCSDDDEAWKGENLEIPDFGDTFIYVRPEALLPRRFEYESVLSEEYSLEARIMVAGIPICIKIQTFSIEVIVEGEMEQALAVAIAEDIRESVEADTGIRCNLETYP